MFVCCASKRYHISLVRLSLSWRFFSFCPPSLPFFHFHRHEHILQCCCPICLGEYRDLLDILFLCKRSPDTSPRTRIQGKQRQAPHQSHLQNCSLPCSLRPGRGWFQNTSHHLDGSRISALPFPYLETLVHLTFRCHLPLPSSSERKVEKR